MPINRRITLYAAFILSLMTLICARLSGKHNNYVKCDFLLKTYNIIIIIIFKVTSTLRLSGQRA